MKIKAYLFFMIPLCLLANSASHSEIDFARMTLYQQKLLIEQEHQEFRKSQRARKIVLPISVNDEIQVAPLLSGKGEQELLTPIDNPNDVVIEYHQGLTREALIDTEQGQIFGDGKEFLSEKEVVLTFDDGPNPATTPAILDILKRHNIKAVFFIVGHRLFSSPEAKAILKRIASEGHSIGNHSYTHPGFKSLFKMQGKDAVMNEIASTHQAIFNTVGFVDSFFRFPGGTYNEALQQIIKDNRLTNWKWNIDSLDYMDCKVLDGSGASCLQKFSIGEMAENAKKNVSNGLNRYQKGIVLFHDIKPQTVLALPDILNDLIAKNYTFVLPKTARPESRSDNPTLDLKTKYRVK